MDSRESAFVLGQRYTLATLALGLALLSFLNLAGMEKARRLRSNSQRVAIIQAETSRMTSAAT